MPRHLLRMLGYVLNGSWSAGLMPIARSGTTILMPRPVTAGRLLRLPAPGAGLIGRWGGSIKCTSAYSSHATVASPGIRRANFLPLLRCTLTDTALIACKSFKVSRRCAVVCSVGSGASSALPGILFQWRLVGTFPRLWYPFMRSYLLPAHRTPSIQPGW